MNRIGKRTGNVLVGAAIIAAVATAWWRHVPAGEASLRLEPESMELADMIEGEARDVTFTLHNDGGSAREIKVKTSCACSTPLQAALSIAPGSTVSVPIRVDTRVSPGGNTAAVQILDGEALVTESMLTFRSSPDLVAEPAILRARALGEVAAAELHCVGSRLLGELQVSCTEPALTASIVRIRPRTWRLELRRQRLARSTQGPCEITVTEQANGRVLRRIPVAASSLPDAELRVAGRTEITDDGRHRMWALLEGLHASGLRVTAARCGNDALEFSTDAAHDQQGSAKGQWVLVHYGAELAGRTATLHYESAVGSAEAELRLL